MIEGIYFYWISWIFWVVVTFFMSKSLKRTFFSFWILLAITLTNIYLNVSFTEVSLAFIIILLGGFVLFTRLPYRIFHLFATFTLMVGYSGFLIWESQAPVWLFMPRLILLPILLIILICILTTEFYHRLAIAIIGISCGEFLFGFLLSSYYIPHLVGEKTFFDLLVIVLFLLFIIELINRLKKKLVQNMQIYRQSLRWQNE